MVAELVNGSGTNAVCLRLHYLISHACQTNLGVFRRTSLAGYYRATMIDTKHNGQPRASQSRGRSIAREFCCEVCRCQHLHHVSGGVYCPVNRSSSASHGVGLLPRSKSPPDTLEQNSIEQNRIELSFLFPQWRNYSVPAAYIKK